MDVRVLRRTASYPPPSWDGGGDPAPWRSASLRIASSRPPEASLGCGPPPPPPPRPMPQTMAAEAAALRRRRARRVSRRRRCDSRTSTSADAARECHRGERDERCDDDGRTRGREDARAFEQHDAGEEDETMTAATATATTSIVIIVVVLSGRDRAIALGGGVVILVRPGSVRNDDVVEVGWAAGGKNVSGRFHFSQ